jgi:hypothetical protein
LVFLSFSVAQQEPMSGAGAVEVEPHNLPAYVDRSGRCAVRSIGVVDGDEPALPQQEPVGSGSAIDEESHEIHSRIDPECKGAVH